jgi:AcrR family transcriptional regulator
MTPEERGQPVRLDRERILDAAAEIVGNEGLPALTMRRIGAALGVDPTAVYRHFRNKREMLIELADRLFATEPELDPEAPWRERMRAWMWHAMRRYRNHLDLGLLLAGQRDDLPSLVRIRERSLGLLTEVGLTLEQASLFSQVIENHVVGCGLFFAVSGWHTDPPHESLEAMRRFYAMLPADTAPLTREAAPHLCPDPDEVFAYTNDLLIAAIERTAAAAGEEVARA